MWGFFIQVWGSLSRCPRRLAVAVCSEPVLSVSFGGGTLFLLSSGHLKGQKKVFYCVFTLTKVSVFTQGRSLGRFLLPSSVWLRCERSVRVVPIFGWVLNLVALFASDTFTDNFGFFFFLDRWPDAPVPVVPSGGGRSQTHLHEPFINDVLGQS